MNSVGIDVSKGKSMVAVMRPFGEVVASPFEVAHTEEGLNKLAQFIKGLSGETKAVMEYTSSYYLPIARYLHKAGIFVCVEHALLVHRYGGNTIRKGKTDKIDSVKIANYGLDHWVVMKEYVPEDELRRELKMFNRQYSQYMNIKVNLANNLTYLLDQTFPTLKELFTSPPLGDGHEKWIDFAGKFWHCECICRISENAFKERYRAWCKKAGYLYSEAKAEDIYVSTAGHVNTLPYDDATKLLVTQAVAQINSVAETMATILHEVQRLAAMLPEYPIVMAMPGVGSIIGPRLMAEIGDVGRFTRKEALVAFAGVDAPPYQSGTYNSSNCRISKRGSPHLRKALFVAMSCLLRSLQEDDPVYQFMRKKQAEGKPYLVYMMAGANKFLRIYYARVSEHLDKLNAEIV